MLGRGGPVQLEVVAIVGSRESSEGEGYDEETKLEELGGGRVGLGGMGFNAEEEEEEEEDVHPLIQQRRIEMPLSARG